MEKRRIKLYFQILEMILNTKEAFKSILETNDWLQEADKEASIEKVRVERSKTNVSPFVSQ